MAGKGSANTREDLAGVGSGSFDTGVSTGGQEIDVSQYEQPTGPQEPGTPQQPGTPEGTQQDSYFDEAAVAAAAAEAERQARIEAERRRIAELNERQHRENDERNREDGLSRQQETGSAQSQVASTAVTADATPSSNAQEAEQSNADDAATMRPVEIFTETGERVVIDENSGNLLEGYDTEYGRELARMTARDRSNQARQARISRTLNDVESDAVVNRDQNELERDADGLTAEDYQRWNDQSFYQDSQAASPWERYEEIAATTGPSINDAIQLDAARQYAEQQTGQTYEQYQQQRRQQQQAGQQQQQQQQQQSQQPVEEEEPMYQQVEDFIRRTSQERITQAHRANELERRAWLEAHPEMTAEDYELSDEYWEDAEAFEHVLRSMLDEQYTTFDNVQRDENGEIIDTGVGIEQKENKKQARLIQSVIRSFRLGFFHITTERIDTDENTGEQNLRWSAPVETRIIRLCDYFGMDYNALDSQRTVFRLVTLYASMGVDRNGKMFKEDQGEWSLTEDEFCQICDMIYMSCIERGHPLAPPWRTSIGEGTLRGTDIIPSGVLPIVVARAITGENSRLRNAEGNVPLPSELIEQARQIWVTDTYPWIRENLVNEPQRGRPRKDKDGNVIKPRNRMAQRIAIEDMQQALARIDGHDASVFSDQYGVDTTLHYRIEEYRNTHKLYAEAADDMFDDQAVSDYQDELLEAVENDRKQQHGREYGAIQACANIVTSGIRTNALFWNVPIAVSAVMEKGVGDVQTDWAIRSIASRTERITGSTRMSVSQQLRDAMKTEEAHQAIDAALFLMDTAGPQALMSFRAKNPNTPLTPETAIKFINEEYLPQARSSKAARAREIQNKLSKFQQTILTGDTAFKNYDAKNFLNAFLTCNQVLVGAQQQLLEQGIVDQHAGLALTGEEIDDAFMACHGDIAMFIGDMMQLAAGRDAMIMMRSNNIGNFNPVGYAVNRFLRNHGVTDAAITAVLDSFPKYGINFLYAITPFSRSLSYLAMKRREAGGDALAGMFVMGGGLADVSNTQTFSQAMQDPAFTAGLRMNLMYDAMTFARWGITSVVLGGVMAILGFEPPDDPNLWQNVSRWKIGGQELQLAYWLNDLSQLGLPLATGFAATLSGHGDKAFQLTMNSLYDQIDGNVVVDFAKYVKGWGEEMEEIDKIATDPTYISGFNPGYGLLELALSASDKIVPGAPLYRYIANDSFIRGEDAGAKSPYKVFDKSTDWAKQVGKTDYVTSPHERQIRKHCTANWALAAYEDFVHGVLFNQESDETGYFWWEMPDKTKADQLVLTWMKEQEMDFTNREGCATDEAYKEHKTDQLLAQINKVSEDYGGLDQAIMHGYVITHDVRYAALEVLSDRLAQEDIVFQNKIDTGELPKYSDEFYTEKAAKDARVAELWKYVHILQNKDIPVWYEGYRQILSDKEVDYFHEDGTSASPWEYFFPINGPVTVEYKNKGNHPWALAPFTLVDKESDETIKRGFSGETLPFWYTEGKNGGTDLEAIRNGIGQNLVPMGADAGKVLNDVLFNAVEGGEGYLHPDQATIHDRAWAPVKGYLSDDIANFDVAARVKEAIAKDDAKIDDAKDSSKKPSYYPRSFGGGSSGRRSYGKSSYEYNPKIYNTRAQNTHISNSRISGTRTNPNSRNVNADRAATMYSKQPQNTKVNTSLRPGFETKGSREAYKRQDI